MDYGSFLSYSVTEPRPARPASASQPSVKLATKAGTAKATTAPSTKPAPAPKMKEPPLLAAKGITVRLGHDACVLFDTDLMRFAAGWTGGFLDLSKTNIGGLKGDFPAAAGPTPVHHPPGPRLGQGRPIRRPPAQSPGAAAEGLGALSRTVSQR